MIPKFRAWDKEEKRMSYGKIEYYDDSFGVRFDHFCVGADFEVEFMQSTGLKDKNGVEIFEGDIVDIEVDNGFDYGSFIGVIDYLEGSWMVNNRINYARNLWSEADQFELLGNIYENPELLEQANES